MGIFERVGLPEKFLIIWGFCMVLIFVDAYTRGGLLLDVSGGAALHGAVVAIPALLVYEGLRKAFDRALTGFDTEVRVELYLSVVLFSLFVSFSIFGLGIGAVGDRAPSPTDNPYVSIGASELDADEAERLVHQEVNRVRLENGLSELEYDEELAEISRSHSQDMAVHSYIGHVDSEGRNQIERAREAGYRCSKETHTGVGENAHGVPFRERIWGGWIYFV